MDFHRRLTLLPLVALCLFGVLNAQTIDANLTQYGGLVCITKGDILSVDISVVKNGSNIVGVEYANYDNWEIRYRTGTAGCIFTGNGSFNNPFMTSLEVNITSDTSSSNSTYCGHKQVGVPANGDPKVYSWVVHTYREIDKETHEDLYIIFTCAANDLPTYLSINYTILPPEPTKDIDANHGLLRLDVVDTNNNEVSTVSIGTPVRLMLQFTPSQFMADGHSIGLRPWGIYCKKLYATPDIGSPRKVDLQDTYGCPRENVSFFRPTSSFKTTNAANKYIARTGNMSAARFDALVGEEFVLGRGKVVFVCEADFCIRPSNGICQDRCQSPARRKRQAPTEPVTLVTYINVVDYMPETAKEESSTSLPVGYIVGLGVTGVVVLAAVVLFGVCMYMRRPQHNERYYRQSNPSSVTSTTKTTTTHSRTGSSAYSSSNKAFKY